MSEILSVLIVEDNQADVDLIREALPETGPVSFQIESVSRLSEAAARLKNGGVDLILLDLGLPDSQGLETFRKLRETTARIPVIISTTNDDQEMAVLAMREGAQDYLIKGLTWSRLLTNAILYAVERKRSEEKLRKSEEYFREITENASDIILVVDKKGTITYASPSVERILGYKPEELISKSSLDLIVPADYQRAIHDFGKAVLAKGALVPNAFRVRHKDGSERILEGLGRNLYKNPSVAGFVMNVRDVTERKRTQVQEHLAREILELLNHPKVSKDTVCDILQLVKKNTGFEAVGIRLQEGDDFPYYKTNGFSEDFVQAERYLCVRDEEGKIVRDGKGNPELECMCGNIICGRTDPALPFFTEGGSFWSNCTTELLASTTEEDRQARTRNRCNDEGYESVALIPLRSGDEVIGLLQLNDRRKYQFTPSMINFFEGLAASIGIALTRKRAERTLAEAAQEWQTTFDATNDAIWILDQDQLILRSNKTAERFFHRPFEEMTGKHCWEIVHGTTQPIPDCPILRVRKSLHRETMELQTGESWFEVHVDPILDAAGRYSGAIHIVSDITERKQSEAAIRANEERFRAIFERSTVGKSLTAPDGRILKINKAFADMLGYTIDEIQQINFAQITHPDDVVESRECIRTLLANVQTVCRFEKRYIRKNGDILWADISTTLLRDEQGMPLYLITSIVNITERKQTEDNIKQKTDAMEAAVDGMALLDKDGKYVYLNKAHVNIYGYENDVELIGKSWIILYDADELKRIEAEIMPNLLKNGHWQGEALGMKKDGSKFPQEISLTALDNRGLICIVRDITERRRVETELKESKALIETVVENVPLMIFLKEAKDLRFVIFNRAGEELLGYDRKDLMGKNNLDLFPPEQAAHFMTKDREVLDGEAGIMDIPEEPILTARKGQRLLHTRKVRIRGSDGVSKFLLGISEDITERKRTEKQLIETLESLRRAVGATVQVMASAVEARDPYTSGHQIRSADLARAIGTEMELPSEKIEGIRMAGSIHDIGKLSIPAEILSKPTKLSEIEFSLIKEHSRKGFEILKDVESPWPLAEIVYQHHERMDGSGYPRNLKGDEILMEARILAVSDVVEAMASHRPYRAGLGIDAALNEIEKNRGLFYDNAVADACLRLFREKSFQFAET